MQPDCQDGVLVPHVSDPTGRRCGKVVVMPIQPESDKEPPKPSGIRRSIEMPRAFRSGDTTEKLEHLRSELRCVEDTIAILERLAIMRGLHQSDLPAISERTGVNRKSKNGAERDGSGEPPIAANS